MEVDPKPCAIDSTYELITNYIDEKQLEPKDVFVEQYMSDPVTTPEDDWWSRSTSRQSDLPGVPCPRQQHARPSAARRARTISVRRSRRRDAGGRQLIVASRRFLARNAARSTPLAIRPDNPHVKFAGLS